jgi:alpha-beta hydrolase superfamily lysophospholipase
MTNRLGQFFTGSKQRRILTRVVFYGLAVFIGVPLAFSQVLIGTVRQPTHDAPTGWREQWVTSEGLRLRAWVHEGEARRPGVVVVHGVGDTLESYLPVGTTLVQRGHTVLLLDLRGHGRSEGKHMTLGGRERQDVRAAMDQLRAGGLAENGLLLMGYSMGAVAVLRAAADRPDVRGVVVEAPFDSYRDTTRHHARLLYGLPGWIPLIPIAIRFAEWRAGFAADDVDALAAARHIQAPLFALADGADPRMPEAVVRRVFDAHPGPKRMWVTPGVDHVGAQYHPEYWPRVLAFLEESGL